MDSIIIFDYGKFYSYKVHIINNDIYYGNEYLYTNLAMISGGEYLLFIKSLNNFNVFSMIFLTLSYRHIKTSTFIYIPKMDSLIKILILYHTKLINSTSYQVLASISLEVTLLQDLHRLMAMTP